MKYNLLFCTLAIGNEYNGYAQRLFKSIVKATNNRLLVVTDNVNYFDNIKNNKLIVKQLDKTYVLTSNLVDEIRNFNYNLKYVPIYFANKEDCDFIVYLDCDWFIKPNGFNFHKFEARITEMLGFGFDGIAGRGRRLIDEKKERTFLPKEKIEFYGLDKTDKYDNCQVINEQYIILRKTDKINKFIDAWSILEKKCTAEKGMAYAEGLEIGMAALDSNIKFHICSTLGDAFIFYTNKSKQFYEI